MTWQLFRRIGSDHRRLVVPLVVVAGLNVAGYGFIVYPLALKVAAHDTRAASVARDLAAAEQAMQQARAMVDGKGRADTELRRFYGEVLPTGQREARRITYLQLAEMAQRANLSVSRRTFSPGQDRDSSLARLDLTMAIDGAYRDMRRFIHAVETAPEFVVINQVALAQRERGGALALSLQLTTYFRADDGQ